MSDLSGKVALVTGAAKRLGAATATALHDAGANVVVHYNQSGIEAQALVAQLNEVRKNSASLIGTPLGTRDQALRCVEHSLGKWDRLDIVINNASSFYPTPLGSIDDAKVSDLFASNLNAPLFITQAARDELSRRQGVVINMVDIHGFSPHQDHSVYCAAKAALIMLTRSLARELAPDIRVNGIAPGAILWPENTPEESTTDAPENSPASTQENVLKKIPLGRCGAPDDIANLIVYLCSDAANYITGEIIKVDGGRSA